MNKVKVKLIKLHTKIIYNKSNLEINKALKTFAGERRLNQSLHDWNTVGQSPGWRGGCGMEAIESNFLWIWKYLKLWANTRTEHMIWWFHNSKAMTNNWKTDSLKWSIRVQFVTWAGRVIKWDYLTYIIIWLNSSIIEKKCLRRPQMPECSFPEPNLCFIFLSMLNILESWVM